MHLGNGALTPGCAAVTFGVATAGLGWAAATLRRSGIDRNQCLTAGALAGAIFAAQSVNVPVLPFTSAHLVGGVLAAWVSGPALGAVVMATVLACQALLLGDGGLLALGANFINMGLLPAVIVAVFGRRATRMTAGGTAALAVILAALLIIGEVSFFRGPEHLAGWSAFALRMVALHCWIALPEGVLTVALLIALGGIAAPGRLRLDDVRLGACWGAAVLLIVSLLPIASRMPDGYEAAAERSGLAALLIEDPADLASLGMTNAAVAAWQGELVGGLQAALINEQFLMLVATLCAGAAALGLATLFGTGQVPATVRPRRTRMK
jgi:cobalt/nickel transport system permease protein